MIYVIPEVGGDAGISAAKMVRSMDGDARIVGIDSNSRHAASGLVDETIVSPSVQDSLQVDQKLIGYLHKSIEALGEQRIAMCPTHEATTMTLIELVRTSEVEIVNWLPSKKAFMLSRNKRSLSKERWACSESDSNGEVFRKPVAGSGSRGCMKVSSSKVDRFIDGDSVFFPVLSGPEVVVDVFGGFSFARIVGSQKGGQDVSVTFVDAPDVQSIALDISSEIGASVLNVQFMWDEYSPLVTDIGTRFSGASACLLPCGINPMSILMGSDPGVFTKRSVVRRLVEVPVE